MGTFIWSSIPSLQRSIVLDHDRGITIMWRHRNRCKSYITYIHLDTTLSCHDRLIIFNYVRKSGIYTYNIICNIINNAKVYSNAEKFTTVDYIYPGFINGKQQHGLYHCPLNTVWACSTFQQVYILPGKWRQCWLKTSAITLWYYMCCLNTCFILHCRV